MRGDIVSTATDIANDMAAIRQKFQSTNAFDGTLRQMMTQILAANENEGLYERWSTEVEPQVRNLGESLAAAETKLAEKDATISAKNGEIAIKDGEIARLTALLEQPPALVAVPDEYPDGPISGTSPVDDITGYKRPPLRDINSA